MKKLFTLLVFMACFMGAKAIEITDAFVDFSTVTEIPRFSWGGSESAFARLSLQNGCLHFHSEEATDPSWDCQFFPIGGVNAEPGVVYTLHYKVKGDHAGNVSMLGFGQTPYGQFAITTDWVEGTVDYECTEANGNILMQCGDWIGDWDIAYLKITHEGRVERPVEWIELLTNGDAESAWENPDTRWNDEENNYKICVWTKEKGFNVNDNGGSDPHPAEIVDLPEGGHAFICRATLADTEGDAAAWDNQIWLQSPRAWKTGEQFQISFRYKASQDVVTNTQFHHQNPSDYLFYQAIGDISFSTEWKTFEQTITVPSDGNGAWSVAFNLNPNVKTPTDFYIDDLSWKAMKLDEGLFVASANTVTGIDYDYDNAIEFVYDEAMDAMAATVGTAGKEATWVNELMISTVRGNDRQFKANTIKPKGAILDDPETWLVFEDTPTAKIKLPGAGVWTIYVDVAGGVMSFDQVEGEEVKEPIEIKANPNEFIVNAVERAMSIDEAKAAGLLANPDEPTEEEKAQYSGQPWDNQFFLIGNRALEVNEQVVVAFDYMAETPATVGTQNSEGAGGYLHYAGLGNIDFGADWAHFEETITIPAQTSGNQNSWTFNLANMREANTYHFKNIIFKTADDTESLIDMETMNTANFQKKEGANTPAIPADPDGIENVVANKTVSNVYYNLAGQRVGKNYKGIVVNNNRKVVVK